MWLHIHARELWGIQDWGPRGIRDKGTYGNQGRGALGESGTGGLKFIRYRGLEGIPNFASFLLVIVDSGNSPRIAFLVSTGKIMILMSPLSITLGIYDNCAVIHSNSTSWRVVLQVFVHHCQESLGNLEQGTKGYQRQGDLCESGTRGPRGIWNRWL